MDFSGNVDHGLKNRWFCFAAVPDYHMMIKGSKASRQPRRLAVMKQWWYVGKRAAWQSFALSFPVLICAYFSPNSSREQRSTCALIWWASWTEPPAASASLCITAEHPWVLLTHPQEVISSARKPNTISFFKVLITPPSVCFPWRQPFMLPSASWLRNIGTIMFPWLLLEQGCQLKQHTDTQYNHSVSTFKHPIVDISL